MVKIFDIACQLQNELKSQKNARLEDFRIFIRLNLEIDVFIISDSSELLESLQNKYKDYAVNFKKFTRTDLDDFSYLSASFSSEDTIDFGLKYRFNSLLNKKPNLLFTANKKHKTPIVAFYSYKGGMGRTTTLTSYALDLAINERKKVLIMDCDFEAPGYLNFFNLNNYAILRSGEKNGIVEFLVDYNFQRNTDIHNYIISPEVSQDADPLLNNIFIMPAGNLSDTAVIDDGHSYVTHRDQYLEGLARLDLANEHNIISGFESMFDKIHHTINPDIILIDSRTGFNDVFGVSALVLSDIIVGFFGSSEQTKPGLRFLLDRFYDLKLKFNSQAELVLINSILPPDNKKSEDFHSSFVNEVAQYVQFIQEKKFNKAINEQPQLPSFYKLSRNHTLERLGVKESENDNSDSRDHIALIKSRSFSDYKIIFQHLNETKAIGQIFPKIQPQQEFKRTIELKNIILRKLKGILRNENGKPKLFAEDAEISPDTFFYRDQMKELFDRKKFIIQGFKGTGKTYLYKALVNPGLENVKKELLTRAGKKDNSDYRFVDIISLKGTGAPKSFDFKKIQMSEIPDKPFYFTNFWLVYTWAAILLDAKVKLGYTKESKLHSYIKSIEPTTETKLRFDELIFDANKIVEIENDLQDLDRFLEEKGINLVVLYDQLDNLIKPSDWRESVSPLIDYWWDNLNRFRNITPKIFIRTDLYNRLTGTNTTRLENNIIKIEWSREEVYSFFFKLVFSDKEAYDAIFEIMTRSKRYDETFTKNARKYLARNSNQLTLYRNEIEPFMTIFFGKEVRSYQGSLGNTFDWFYFNLTNADQKSISLRPFINLVDGAIDKALQDPDAHVKQIIDQKYYATRENRDYAVKQHFDDLIREDFNKDLAIIFTYLKEKGESFKQIFLYKSELNDLLSQIFETNKHLIESKSPDELKEILISNGIIHENVKPGENIFYFAQLYKYWLGLQSRKYDFKRPSTQYRKG